jgi:hypothetical protein
MPKKNSSSGITTADPKPAKQAGHPTKARRCGDANSRCYHAGE